MSGDQLFIVAIIGQLVTLTVAILGYRQSRANHRAIADTHANTAEIAKSVNGMKSELVFTAALAAQRKGELEGRDHEAARHPPLMFDPSILEIDDK